MFFLPLSLQHSSQEQALDTEFNDMKSPAPSETVGLGCQGQRWPGKGWGARRQSGWGWAVGARPWTDRQKSIGSRVLLTPTGHDPTPLTWRMI